VDIAITTFTAGIKNSKVCIFEEFRPLPKVNDAVKIASVFGVPVDSLIASDMSKRILKRTG
jgi:hypothetical protein